MSKPSDAEIERQVTEKWARGLSTLPAAWYEPGCAARMADWIKRNVIDPEM